MKRLPIVTRSQESSPSNRRLLCGSVLFALLGVGFSLNAQEVLWSETFETDGEGSRYVTEGAGSFEIAEFADFGVPDNQAGPVLSLIHI